MIIYQDKDPLFVFDGPGHENLIVMNFKFSKPNLKLAKILRRHFNDPCFLYGARVTGVSHDSITMEYKLFKNDNTLFLSEYKDIVKSTLYNMIRVKELFEDRGEC